MNDSKHENESGKGHIDEVGALIRHVGAREAVAPERLKRSHARVLEHWEQVVAEQGGLRGRSRLRSIALAASLVVVGSLAAILWSQRGVSPVTGDFVIERMVGTVMVNGRAAGQTGHIEAGSLISTPGQGRVALRMPNGQSLRVDKLSEVSIESATRVGLQAGAVYVDSDFAAAGTTLQVQTPMGVAADIGTRFQVRLRQQSLIVGVADGLVEVTREGGERHSVDKGYSLALSDGDAAERTELDATRPDWNWVETVTPGFTIEGATLEQYLAWYAHERGLELEWADDVSLANARNTELSGSISGASLAEGLELVSRIAPFRHETNGRRFLVSVE